VPGALTRFKVDWLTHQKHIMGLCFLIGAVQLSIAHLWNIARQRKSLQALAQIGWLGITWVMYFAAGAMVLNRPFPPFMTVVLIACVALIVLFMTPARKMKTEWINHVMLPLNLVSSFVDIVSYIRLFAVGTATVAVAQAFNEIAIGSGVTSIGRGIAAALILFIGHALNIVLAGMGVIVHGVRLNTLEFSGHLGMQWTGVPYRPFARATVADGVNLEGRGMESNGSKA
jgi:V/A-type H+/Na+-transporting ATPase subunit I